MKKKMATLMAAGVMAASLAGGISTQAEEAAGGFKIGFYYAPTSDTLSMSFHKALDYCAELTGCEMEYYDMNAWDSEAISAAVETLVSNGCDGVIMMVGSSPSLFEYMASNSVYYVGMTRQYNEEVAKTVDGDEYNCGFVGDLGGKEGQNFKAGYDLISVLAEEGCTRIALLGGSEGETLNDERIAGMEQAADDNGMEVVSVYRGRDFVTGAADILAAYGTEIDGLASSGSGDSCIAAIQTAGLSGQIKFAQIDQPSGDVGAYMDAGLLSATCVGNNTYIIDMYMQLYNALSGADRLWNETDPRIVPIFQQFVIKSSEEYEAAKKYTDGEIPGGVLPEDIKSLNSLMTPGMSIEEREAQIEELQSAENWNLASISERIGAYLGE